MKTASLISFIQESWEWLQMKMITSILHCLVLWHCELFDGDVENSLLDVIIYGVSSFFSVILRGAGHLFCTDQDTRQRHSPSPSLHILGFLDKVKPVSNVQVKHPIALGSHY